MDGRLAVSADSIDPLVASGALIPERLVEGEYVDALADVDARNEGVVRLARWSKSPHTQRVSDEDLGDEFAGAGVGSAAAASVGGGGADPPFDDPKDLGPA